MVSHWGMVGPFAFRTQWDHNLGHYAWWSQGCYDDPKPLSNRCQTVWSKGCYDDPKWFVNSSTTCVLVLSHAWSWPKVCNLQALRHPRLVSFIGAMEPTGWGGVVKLVARWCWLPPSTAEVAHWRYHPWWLLGPWWDPPFEERICSGKLWPTSPTTRPGLLQDTTGNSTTRGSSESWPSILFHGKLCP